MQVLQGVGQVSASAHDRACMMRQQMPAQAAITLHHKPLHLLLAELTHQKTFLASSLHRRVRPLDLNNACSCSSLAIKVSFSSCCHESRFTPSRSSRIAQALSFTNAGSASSSCRLPALTCMHPGSSRLHATRRPRMHRTGVGWMPTLAALSLMHPLAAMGIPAHGAGLNAPDVSAAVLPPPRWRGRCLHWTANIVCVHC